MSKKFKLLRIASHEFHRSLRAWKSDLAPKEMLKNLLDERTKALKVFLQALALSVLGTFWLASNAGNLTLKISVLDVTIPAGYVNFAVAFALVGSVIQLINYFVLNEFVRVASNRLFKFDNSSVLMVPYDGSSAWSLGWVQQYRFLASSKPHRFFGILVVLTLLIPLAMIWLLVFCNVILVGISVIRRDGPLSATGAFNVAALFLTLFPIFLLLAMSTRFTFKKNTSFVRWLFLTKIYRREGRWPPRSNNWTQQC